MEIRSWNVSSSNLRLECQVYAQPKATVQWIYQNKAIINNTDHIVTSKQTSIGNLNILYTYTLTIDVKNIKKEAFKCHVNNSRLNCHLQYLCVAFYVPGEISMNKPPSVEFNGKFSFSMKLNNLYNSFCN